MDEGCWKITGRMTIAEIVERHPRLEGVFDQLGMACCSCFGASSDTVAQVARVYGLDPEIVVHTLNVALLFLDQEVP